MTLIRPDTTIFAGERGAVAALGNFDGVHRGHQMVIAEGRAIAERLGVPFGIVTFEPHPQALFKPADRPFRLTTLPDKAELLRHYGADIVFPLAFDRSLAGMMAQDFVLDVLIGQLGLVHIVAGYDFRFGQGRGGDRSVLAYMGDMEGLGVTIIEKIAVDGEKFSSSTIRQLLQDGRPREAARFLGHPWFIRGTVAHGDQRGRILGFPTANIELGDVLEPALGVYAVRVARASGQTIDGIANIGRRPTFGGETVRLEAFLFDFDGDLYGETLTVELIDFVRPERKFDGLEALKAQIAVDVEAARRALAPTV